MLSAHCCATHSYPPPPSPPRCHHRHFVSECQGIYLTQRINLRRQAVVRLRDLFLGVHRYSIRYIHTYIMMTTSAIRLNTSAVEFSSYLSLLME